MVGENARSNAETEQQSDGASVLSELAGKFDPDRAKQLRQEALRRRQEAEKKMELAQRQRVVWAEAMKLHKKLNVENASRGLYSYETPDGAKVFGSVYSILDMHDELGAMSTKAEMIRSGGDDDSLMGIEVSEGAGYESVVVASGSFAQREINPYPADMDFAEHLKITAEDNAESGKILSSLLASSLERASQDGDTVFTEMKVGTYPQEAGDLAGKSIKWSRDEIARGEKVITTSTGEEVRIGFEDACGQPGSMIKIDWLTVAGGQVKEMTKVINLTVETPDGEERFSNSQKSSAFQEIYFGDPSHFNITEQTLEPDVSEEYLSFLKRDVGKYSALGHENFLKVAKRSYNYLKCSGRVKEARELAPLFNSSISELASRSESLGLLPDYLEENTKDGRAVDLSTFADSFDKLQQNVDALAQDGTIPADEQKIISDNITYIQEILSSDPQEARKRIGGLTSYFSSVINNRAKSFLDGVNIPQKIMV